MNYSSFSLVALLLVGTVTTGCASSPLSPINPSGGDSSTALTAGQIAGTWALSSIQPAGEAEQSVPAGASYALVLTDGHASTTADCNVCGGNLVVDGQTLTVGPLLACTRAACPTMAFENTYVAILAGASAAQADANALTLTSSRGVLRFRR
jgi:heat shock protein HslJ